MCRFVGIRRQASSASRSRMRIGHTPLSLLHVVLAIGVDSLARVLRISAGIL